MASAFKSSGDQVGWSCLSSAIAPVTCGAAIDVPLIDVPRKPLFARTDQIDCPGAVISGLMALSSMRGPRELNDDRRSLFPAVTIGSAPSSSALNAAVTPPPRFARIRSPVSFGTSVEGMLVAPAMAMSRSFLVWRRITPIAPAAKALPTRVAEPQSLSLQSRRAILPVTIVRSDVGNDEQPVSCDAGRATVPVTAAVLRKSKLTEWCAVYAFAIGDGAVTCSASAGSSASTEAATLRTWLPLAGDPVM